MAMSTKHRSKTQSRGTRALLDSLAELEGAVRDGLTIEQLKDRFPNRVRIVVPEPGKYLPAQVKALRQKFGVSQDEFASLVGVSRILVQGWERGVRKPSALACRLLDTIRHDPAGWLAGLNPSPRVSAARRRRAG
jgi:DNA-binding transcriptional regulator YiaG